MHRRIRCMYFYSHNCSSSRPCSILWTWQL